MKPVLAISLVVLAIPVVLAQTIEEQTKLLEEQNKQLCISACGSGDVDCHAVCDHAPHPKPVHMNLMTECVAHCTYVQADGSAAALAQYNICRKSCIDGYMALKGDLAAPTTKTWTDVAPSTWSAVSVSVETTSGVSDVTGRFTDSLVLCVWLFCFFCIPNHLIGST
jgi:hypothetical protein